MSDDAARAYGQAAAVLIRVVSETIDEARMLWLEGPDRAAVRRPYGALDVHLATDDPRFAPLWSRLGEILTALGATRLSDADAPLDGKTCRAELPGGHPLTLHFERMALLAKRSRAAVAPLVDKTGHLRHVLDYSAAPISDRLA